MQELTREDIVDDLHMAVNSGKAQNNCHFSKNAGKEHISKTRTEIIKHRQTDTEREREREKGGVRILD